VKADVEGRFWLNVEGRGFLGLGRIELLERIEVTGSIAAAARAMGMSYKAAWDSIDAMNNLADQPLLIRQVGGRHGGGTRLTEYGQRVIRQYRAAEGEYQRIMVRMREHLEHLGLKDPPDGWNFIRRLSMRTSARNQFQGKVVRFSEGR
jgi:molybdate transport system regulatory protein